MSVGDNKKGGKKRKGPGKVSRRLVLRGAAGVVMSLPLLEGLSRPGPVAAGDTDEPFAIFLRQACGVASAQTNDEIGSEPERFWPRNVGALDAANVADRAVDELSAYLDKLLIVGNVNMESYDYGDGHARGAMQGLTARGPTVDGAAGDSEAAGESIDHRIGAELNAGGRDSLFMYAGRNSGWLGGACISYRGPGNRRSALHNPMNAYTQLFGEREGTATELEAQISMRRRSVNDLVRGQMARLLARPELSTEDRRRLELHRDSIRDIEVSLMCRLSEDEERLLEGGSTVFDSTDGDETLSTARLHMDIVAVAVACGLTRSAAIQVGNGNDGNTRYRNLDTGAPMENYHYLSHRRLSHDSTGTVIPDSDRLHHFVDRHFAQTFRHLLDRLSSYTVPGGTLLDCGVAAWHNDNANGPGHSTRNVPWVLAGSAGGFLRQGQYIEINDGASGTNHAQLLNTIASAAGVRKPDGNYLDDFGDPAGPRGVLPELMV